jgi:hypothetical protein
VAADCVHNLCAILVCFNHKERHNSYIDVSCRVAFRAYQVLTIPVEKLVQVLGLEVPVAPLVSLAGIKADGVLLHWKPPDQRTSVLKYVIRINGIDSMGVLPQHATTSDSLQLATYRPKKPPSPSKTSSPTATTPFESSRSIRRASKRPACPSVYERSPLTRTNSTVRRPKIVTLPVKMTALPLRPLFDQTRASPMSPLPSLRRP